MTHRQETGERRPIASREQKIWQRVAARLVRARVSPNAISIAGMICGVLGGTAMMMTAQAGAGPARLLWLAGAGCTQLRLLANMFDGMVAIESGRASPNPRIISSAWRWPCSLSCIWASVLVTSRISPMTRTFGLSWCGC